MLGTIRWRVISFAPFLTLLLLLVLPAFCQQHWERTYGGSNWDEGRSVRQTSDEGYIIAGFTASFGAGSADVYLIKTDASGNPLWTMTYGGMNGDMGESVRQTSDEGYIIAGTTASFGAGFPDFWLIKTNTSGDTLWTRTYGGTNSDFGYSLQQTSDGGYIIVGTTRSFGAGDYDVYLIKTNASGDTLWTRTWGGTNSDQGESVWQTQDGGYVIAGFTKSLGDTSGDVYLIKANASGNTLWTKTYGGTNSDFGYSVQQTSDGGYIIAGCTASFGAGSADVYLIKTNASGDTLWTKTYGGTNGDYSKSVQQTSDGGYIIAGWTDSFGAGSHDVWLIKTNTSGDTLWTRTWGGAGYDWGWSVQLTSDGGYIIAGFTASFGGDVYLIKTDVGGYSEVEEKRSEIRVQNAEVGLNATPNPFVSFTRISGHEGERFALCDISGKQVGTYQGDRIGVDLAAGVYFVVPEAKDSKPVRIVKVR